MKSKRRRIAFQGVFTTMAGFAFLALAHDAPAAGVSDEWNDTKPLPIDGKEAASLKGVAVTLQETQVKKDGLLQYSADGKPLMEYKILSQEPAKRSKSIIKHLDGTTEILDEETIREVRATGSSSGVHFGVVDFLVMHTMWGMYFGRTSYVPNQAFFASNGAYLRSRNMAPSMVAHFNSPQGKDDKNRRYSGGGGGGGGSRGGGRAGKSDGTFIRSYENGPRSSSGHRYRPATPLTRQSLFAKASVSRGTAVPSSGRSGFFSGARGSGGA